MRERSVSRLAFVAAPSDRCWPIPSQALRAPRKPGQQDRKRQREQPVAQAGERGPLATSHTKALSFGELSAVASVLPFGLYAAASAYAR
jgi:hypothetical protein